MKQDTQTAPAAQPDCRETYERLDLEALDKCIVNMRRLADNAALAGNAHEAEKWQRRVLLAESVWTDKMDNVELIADEEKPCFGEWVWAKRNDKNQGLSFEDGGFLQALYIFEVDTPWAPERFVEVGLYLLKMGAQGRDLVAARKLWDEWKAETEGGAPAC